MQHPDYNSPIALKNFMDENNMAMQKKFGQNFLVNADARKKLIDVLDVKPGMKVWEVGPGLGSMTSGLLERGVNLTVFEIDHGFARLLTQFFEEYANSGNFSLVEGDVLKTWPKFAKENDIPKRFFGNLPYNVAATIIADTITKGFRFDKAVFTIQKEVGQRMNAKPGTEDYSSFSVLCQWAYDVKPVMDLAGGNFWPVPNVASRAVLMTKKEDFPKCENPELFRKMVRQIFALRRKTLRNNLSRFVKAEICDEALKIAGIEPSIRAENLSVEDLLKLSDALNSVIEKTKME
ncbi:16S rRNA (adenine(1518)-N(6)/adenine(1519)-N(6))-dimethyltransferase RsmA [Treponema berlinense]|uniref:Ribosomal RNA small subunit methyltransferase A n=1 Tax=Treponema berlinense TaxID=225004 RepID=A0A1T4KSN8_9SPIR|nr:16S rRNA (adenine(1518)-N(6)/adenine(1519)-N(6))-dimethyltransferase RsmA [Treponema berlinense]MCI5541203.1 16S rRNA (adenine(1518)-N(6)/adenine(1519)-N(6))-dimethyltransferase RsmA [Treponema berlinense]MDY3708438.1 16S rRNA (adenine(1518)-N(6)/adenine(1519)-N(6))-dimethyltransferase RsmA [Treponema berlinense]SJZ45436.1 16S rRNA (adenine1518-N6/adenine1519-N6)-dimethyltransferase [Treponema berlinense]